MLLNTTTFFCTEATGPKFWIAYSDGVPLQPQNYGYITSGFQVSTGQNFLEVFDTELELAERCAFLMNSETWYWECEHRIPHPPNPNEWECEDEVEVDSPVEP